MSKKTTSNLVISSYEEDSDCISFDDSPSDGQCVSSFNFTSSVPDANTKNTDIQQKNINITHNQIIKNDNKIIDNRKSPCPNGASPLIDGEQPCIRRTYVLRKSTIRKINELKSCHPDINVYVSTIVDIAIDHYYNYIMHEGGTQL